MDEKGNNMPALYAHNKFGKLVITQLSEDIKNVIKKYPRTFRVGLQGPDILFFYKAFSKNKINQLGVYYHHHDIFPFMEHALSVVEQYGKDSAEYSYILGFICHFVLDNACHPYINESMKSTGCGHVEIEGDLENLILDKDEFVPELYPIDMLIPADVRTAHGIAHFFEGLDDEIIFDSLRWMKRIKKIFVAPGVFKRTTIDLIMRATLHYKRLKGHVVEPEPNPKCRKNSEHIYGLMSASVSEAVELIENFNAGLEGSKLCDKFHRDFNGNIF